jgi:hypothetical protein
MMKKLALAAVLGIVQFAMNVTVWSQQKVSALDSLHNGMIVIKSENQLTPGFLKDHPEVKVVTFTADCKITTLPQDAFRESKIESIVVPGSVKCIGTSCFTGCQNLTQVRFESESQLKEIRIHAFLDCSALKSITIPGSVTILETGCFSGCKGLTSVKFEKGSQLEKVGDGAFDRCCSLKKVRLPERVTLLGSRCFTNCSALKIVDLSSCARLGESGLHDGVFKNCSSLKELYLPIGIEDATSEWFRTRTRYGSSYDYHHGAGPESIMFTVFDRNEPLDADFEGLIIVFHEGVKVKIGSHRFECTSNLKRIEFGPGCRLTTIGDGAFRYCRALKTVQFETDSLLTSIGNNAFSECSSLESIEIPSSVKRLGKLCFGFCPNMFTVEFEEGSRLREILEGAFAGCPLERISIPNSVEFIGDGCFYHCLKMIAVRFSEGTKLRTLGAGAFEDCNSLLMVAIPKARQEVELGPWIDINGVIVDDYVPEYEPPLVFLGENLPAPVASAEESRPPDSGP